MDVDPSAVKVAGMKASALSVGSRKLKCVPTPWAEVAVLVLIEKK
jgi:hypothetical protein